jgi:hypothetical protein
MSNEAEKSIDKISDLLDKEGRVDNPSVIGSGCGSVVANAVADALYPPRSHKGGAVPRRTRVTSTTS